MKMVTSALPKILAALSFVLMLAFTAAPAQAQATRTWVSGVGDDVNPCSRTAPCKTFAGAISKTAAGGEINCLDPGGYGTVTITKSMTIDCTGTFGSTLNSGGINGIIINDSATGTPGTIDVILRGLSIDGAGTTAGLNGVRFVTGRSLLLEDVFIQNQNTGSGISFQPTVLAEMHLNNVTVTDSGNGILVQPTGTGGAKVTLDNVRIHNNSGTGLKVDSTGNASTAGIAVEARDSDFNGNATGGVSVIGPGATNTVRVLIVDSSIANNVGTGLAANGPGVATFVGDTTITGNTTGVLASGGSNLSSFGNNRNALNPTVGPANNGAFTGTAPVS